MSDADSVNPEEVMKIAQLARLEIHEKEVPRFTKDLNAILGYVETLQSLDLSEESSGNGSERTPTALRPDTVCPSLSPEDALGAAPEKHGTSFVVPKIIG